MDMLCIMHQADPYGHLLNDRGHPVTERMLVALTGIDSITIADLKSELEKNGVFSVNKKGVIYSRRMTRDSERGKKMHKNGRKGGNPSLCNNKQIRGLVNQGDNQGDIPQKPESRKTKTPLTPPNVLSLPDEGGVLKNGKGEKDHGPTPTASDRITFRIEHFLTDEDREKARNAAPGWDQHYLMPKYDEGVQKRGIPTHPALAYVAWCAVYTKGKSP